MTYETPRWLIENDRLERPTEILVPLVEGIGPMWMHGPQKGVWFAYVATAVKGSDFTDDASDGLVMECSHEHPDQESAWACAAAMGRQVAERVLAGD